MVLVDPGKILNVTAYKMQQENVFKVKLWENMLLFKKKKYI